MNGTQPPQTTPQQDKGCQLCRCECSNPPEKGKARLCDFCIGAFCVLIFPGGAIVAGFLHLLGKWYMLVPLLIFVIAIVIRRLGQKRFGKKAQVLDAGLGKTMRIILSLVFFVVIPFSVFWLAIGPLNLITLLPADPKQRAVIFAVIMILVIGECWKDGAKILKGK